MDIFELSPEVSQEMAGARQYLEGVAAGRERRDDQRIKSSVWTFCNYAAEAEIPREFIRYATKAAIDVSAMVDEAIAEMEDDPLECDGDLSLTGAGPNNGLPTEPAQRRMPGLADETLVEMLSLHAQGMSWTDIAAHFGKDRKTIYRWRKEAATRSLAGFSDVAPSQFLTEEMGRLDQLRAGLAKKFDQAFEQDQHDLILRYQKAILRVDEQRLRLADRAGFFAGSDLSLRDRTKPFFEWVNLNA